MIVKSQVANYNAYLETYVANFTTTKGDVSTTLFDSNAFFNLALDNAQAFGFQNITG